MTGVGIEPTIYGLQLSPRSRERGFPTSRRYPEYAAPFIPVQFAACLAKSWQNRQAPLESLLQMLATGYLASRFTITEATTRAKLPTDPKSENPASADRRFPETTGVLSAGRAASDRDFRPQLTQQLTQEHSGFARSDRAVSPRSTAVSSRSFVPARVRSGRSIRARVSRTGRRSASPARARRFSSHPAAS